MNTPESREGNLFRYAVYVIGYLLVVGVVKLVTCKTLNIWYLILFALVAAMILLFYIYRFNREQRFFERLFSLPWLGDYGLTVGLTLGVLASKILVAYLQTNKRIGLYGFQINYLKHESNSLFWFMIVTQGIILPILQEFLSTGFLFNYAFRKNTFATGIVGIICSGLIFAVLNFQFTPALFVINALYGALFAWAYLYSQTLWMPMYLAVIAGLLTVIMI